MTTPSSTPTSTQPEIIPIGNTSFVRFDRNELHNISDAKSISLLDSIGQIQFKYERGHAEYHVCKTKNECADKFNAFIEIAKTAQLSKTTQQNKRDQRSKTVYMIPPRELDVVM